MNILKNFFKTFFLDRYSTSHIAKLGFKIVGNISLPFGGSICQSYFDKANGSASAGRGGGGGSNLNTGSKTGEDGGNGSASSGWQSRNSCGSAAVASGGQGGAGAGGRGGNGETTQSDCGGYPTGRTNGSAGSHYYAYWQLQLFGPAIINEHSNVRIINNGEIAGGYSDGKTIYAVYGASIMDQNETDWNGSNNNGTIYPSSPGRQP